MSTPTAGPGGPVGSQGSPNRWGVPDADLGVLLLAALLVIAFAPPLLFESWTPRFALITAAAPVGVVILGSLAWRRDHASYWLVAAIVWTLLTGVIGDAPRSALTGFVGRDLSAYTIVGCAAIWAIARQLGPRGREVLPGVLLAAATMAAVVALLQVLVDVQTGPLALIDGQPAAFMTNPVYLGAVCAAVLVVGVSWAGSQHAASLAAVGLLGVGVSVSGSRVALAAVIVTLALHAAVRRAHEALVPMASGAVGVVVGLGVHRWLGAGRSASSSLASASSGGRPDAWRYGLEAFGDRPLLGYGFGRYRPAVQGRFSIDFVRDHAADELAQPWFDPHNVVIAVLVAVGVVGLVLFTGFAVTVARSVGGPLAWGVVPIVLHWQLQPVSLVTLPLAALMIGAASTTPSGPATHLQLGERWRWASLGAVGLGLILACATIVGDAVLERSVQRSDASTAAAVARLTGNDPVVSNVVAQVYAFDSSQGSALDRVVEWRRASTRSEGDRPLWWSRLALAQINAGDTAGAAVSVDRAFALQPNNPTTLRTAMVLAVQIEDRAGLAELLPRGCDLAMPECGLDIDDLLPEPSR